VLNEIYKFKNLGCLITKCSVAIENLIPIPIATSFAHTKQGFITLQLL